MAKTKAKINPKTSERLIELLEKKGMNQVWLARKIHISPAMVSKWVKGHAGMTVENAEICAELLGCSPAYLLGFSDYKTDEEEESVKRERSLKKSKVLNERKKKVMDAVMMSYDLRPIEHSSLKGLVKKGSLGSRVGFVSRTDMDYLSSALLDIIDLYVDHFIEQNSNLEEWKDEAYRI